MNRVKAIFTNGSRRVRTNFLWQYDYGQVLQITGIDLPESYEVHFGNNPEGSATTALGNAEGVVIPDTYLQTGESVYAWLFLHTGEDDGETVYEIEIPVIRRAAISNQPPTPVQQDAITQAIAELNSAVDEVEQAVSGVQLSIDTALQAAKDSGEFDGADGAPGADGQDGFSPVVAVTEISGGHQVAVTDASGTETFNVMDGAPGQDGSPGQDGNPGADGFSPTATVSKSGDTATISITDKNGTTSATIKDGYQPVQWELIREDSQTNATEADITIDVDGNGQPFELTDVRLLFWTPVQDVASGKGDYGRVFLYDKDNVQRNGFYWNAWTQAANAAARIAMGEIIQEGGMIETTFTKNTQDTGDTQIYATLRIGQSDPRIWAMPTTPHVYTKIVIKKVTGKGVYRLYGKRKV